MFDFHFFLSTLIFRLFFVQHDLRWLLDGVALQRLRDPAKVGGLLLVELREMAQHIPFAARLVTAERAAVKLDEEVSAIVRVQLDVFLQVLHRAECPFAELAEACLEVEARSEFSLGWHLVLLGALGVRVGARTRVGTVWNFPIDHFLGDGWGISRAGCGTRGYNLVNSLQVSPKVTSNPVRPIAEEASAGAQVFFHWLLRFFSIRMLLIFLCFVPVLSLIFIINAIALLFFQPDLVCVQFLAVRVVMSPAFCGRVVGALG